MRAPPPALGSDDEQTPVKKPSASSTTSDREDGATQPTASNAEKPSPAPSNNPLPSENPRLQSFMAAMHTAAKHRSTLMKLIPAEKFYTCRGYYLHHKLWDFTDDKACKQRLGTTDKEIWSSLTGTVRQDSFATLIRLYGELVKEFDIFSAQ